MLVRRSLSASICLSALLAGCQSTTPLERDLTSRPIPADATAREAECRPLAEIYAAAYVARATWNDARTVNKASKPELEGAMRGAVARAKRLGCPAFWDE
ncbi:hypothetical protein [Pseudomonas sp. Marseille-QA0892]